MLDLPRGWPSIDLRGYREHPTAYVTYSVFDYDRLPPIERALDDGLAWLLAQPAHEWSLASGEEPMRAATGAELDALAGDVGAPAFEAFIRTPEPRTRCARARRATSTSATSR